MKRILITLALVLSVLTIAWANSPAPAGSYEYKFEYNINEKKTNQLASEGWELVTIGSMGSGITSNVQTFVFKRAK